MIHPIYSTVLGHPELVAEHLANYGALVGQEARDAGEDIMGRVVAAGLAAASALMALGLIGVALMLGVLHGSFHWVLAAVPATAIAIAVVAALVAARSRPFRAFADLRTQVDADLRALRAAGEHHGR